MLLTVDLSDIATTRAVAVAVAVAVATRVAAFRAVTELPPPVTFAPVIRENILINIMILIQKLPLTVVTSS